MQKFVLCGSLFFATLCSSAQTVIQRDPEIAGMVSQISSDSLQSYINSLVSFGTRHTLSTTTDKKRGIGAAREWVVQKFRQFATGSNGLTMTLSDSTTITFSNLTDQSQLNGHYLFTPKSPG